LRNKDCSRHLKEFLNRKLSCSENTENTLEFKFGNALKTSEGYKVLSKIRVFQMLADRELGVLQQDLFLLILLFFLN